MSKERKSMFSIIVLLSFLTLALVVCANNVEAKKAAYLVAYDSAKVQERIDILENLNFSVDVITDSEIPTTNFSQYDFILVEDTYFSNHALIPVNEMPALIMNSYHLKDWHWSRKVSSIVSNYPLSTKVIDEDHFIVEGFPEFIRVYTQCCYDSSGVGIPAYYLSRFDKSSYLNVVTATLNNDNDGMIVTALPGTRLRDGVYSSAKGVFFGIIGQDYWTNDSEELFVRSVLWLTRDEVPPTVTIISPEDKTYNTNNILINFTTSEPADCTYKLDDNVPETITGPTYINVPEGSHTLIVECVDSAGNSGSSSVSFSVDTTAPSLTIVKPEEGFYSSDEVELVVTTSLAQGCVYSLNLGSNVSLTGTGTYWNTTITGVEGVNTVVVYCFDDAGNTAEDSVSFTIDTTSPVINNVYHTPEEPNELDDVFIHADVTESNVDKVLVYYRVNSGSWNVLEMQPAWSVDIGSFNIDDFVEYYVFVNDSASHEVTSDVKNFTVQKSDTTPPGMPLNLRAVWQDNKIVLKWDEPTGEKPAYYNVYISDDPFAEVGGFDFSKPNATTSSLNFTDPTAGSVRRRFYVVRAVDSFGNEEKNTFRFGKFDLELKAGMNLVSLPLIPFNNSVFAVMHETPDYMPVWEVMRRKLDGSYDIVTFYPENPPYYWWSSSDFYTLENGVGYWFKSSQDVNFTITGAVATDVQTKSLAPGMQLVGFTSLRTVKLWNAIQQEPENYSVEEVMRRKSDGKYVIATFYPENPPYYWWSDDSLDSLEPGVGYWFKLNKNFVWSYDPEP